MASNFKQDGDVISLTAPYNVASGALAKVGAVVGVALGTVASGAVGSFQLEGIWSLAKVGGQAWSTVGLAIYWDDSAKLCTTTSSANTKIGVNVATAANPSATGYVRLNGAPG